MGKRVREITDANCGMFLLDLESIQKMLGGFTIRHDDFSRDEWLGGDQMADNHEVAPDRCQKAMMLVKEARKMLAKAGHEVALYQAGILP